MAVINPQSYNDYLARLAISQQAEQFYITMPENSKIGELDLNTRKITLPSFVTVQSDHFAETVYFKVNRYYNAIDLLDTVCVIEYINANNKSGVFMVPFYDPKTYYEENKILIPWILDGNLTKHNGVVQFAIKFYRINNQTKEYDYCLKTLPSTMIIQNDLDVDLTEEEEEYEYNYTSLEKIIQDTNQLIENYTNEWELHWEDV